jgi:hypothetical protein
MARELNQSLFKITKASLMMGYGPNVINNYVRKCKAIETYTSVDNAQSNRVP